MSGDSKRKNFLTPGDELIFLPLGGSGEIGMNVNLYGCRGKWVMVDLGMTFADPSYPGVDLILPDLSFIEERREDLLGIVLTHGHEDHIGAIPYLAADLGVPLYATPFTAGLIRGKLIEEGIEKEVKLHVIPNGGSLTLGDFKFRYAAMAHSIPEGNAPRHRHAVWPRLPHRRLEARRRAADRQRRRRPSRCARSATTACWR